MKIILLNDGGFGGMENVEFPVVVDVRTEAKSNDEVIGFTVLTSQLYDVGATPRHDDPYELYFSLLMGECELVEEQP